MPASTKQRLLDLLAIGRVANLPTVWSNVVMANLVGWCLVGASPYHQQGTTYADGFGANLGSLFVLLFGVTFAYLFGTFLNDWKDADFDRQHRPERAIPAGRFTKAAILRLACWFAFAALASFSCLALRHPSALVAGILLLVSITIYTVIHKQTPLAIIPMGLCRSLLYILGFCLVLVPDLELPDLSLIPGVMLDSLRTDPLLVLTLLATGILVYVAGLTLAARYESRPGGLRTPKVFLWFLLFVPLLTHTWWWIWVAPPFLEGWHLAIPALIGLLPFLLWTTRALFVLKKSIPDFVSRTLAGLCLVDLLAYPGIASLIQTHEPFIDNYPLLLALIPLALFILALLLQRLAPAT